MNTSGHNPFEPARPPVPKQDLADPEFRRVEAGRGLEWLRQGWQCFLASPGLWICITAVWVVVMVVLNVVPLFGMIAATLLASVTVGGLMHGCRSLSRGEGLAIDHLWAGFGDRVNPLLALGGWYLAAMFAVSLLVLLLSALVAGVAGLAALAALVVVSAMTSLLLVVAVLLMAPVLMAMWFAPALVMFHRMTALDAMRASFFASLGNAPAIRRVCADLHRAGGARLHSGDARLAGAAAGHLRRHVRQLSGCVPAGLINPPVFRRHPLPP
jgi:hypothetical protein